MVIQYDNAGFAGRKFSLSPKAHWITRNDNVLRWWKALGVMAIQQIQPLFSIETSEEIKFRITVPRFLLPVIISGQAN